MMPLFAKLDANWPDHPKVIRAGVAAAGVHAMALCLCKRLERDGDLERVLLLRVGATDELIDRCVSAGLFVALDDERVFVNDWLDHNLPVDEINAKREADAKRKRTTRKDAPSGRAEASNRTSGSVRDVEVEVETDVEPEPEPAVPPEPEDETGQSPSRRMTAAAALLAQEETDRRSALGELGNPPGYMRSRIPPILAQHESMWTLVLECDPDATSRQLADAVRHPETPQRQDPPRVHPPEFVPDLSIEANPALNVSSIVEARKALRKETA